jgi:hypothetical protein
MHLLLGSGLWILPYRRICHLVVGFAAFIVGAVALVMWGYGKQRAA